MYEEAISYPLNGSIQYERQEYAHIRTPEKLVDLLWNLYDGKPSPSGNFIEAKGSQMFDGSNMILDKNNPKSRYIICGRVWMLITDDQSDRLHNYGHL